MKNKEKYLERCLEIARMGLGNVAPNPMVGCVIVHNDTIIGEGFHQKYGEAHAEVNAIRSVKEQKLLEQSVLYVNLEPCSHYGKTPPCADLILQHKIPEVVIGCMDNHAKVSGKGIKKLKENGCRVITGVLEKESRDLNKRFFTFHEKKRPYVILKWARTLDGFIAPQEAVRTQVSGSLSRFIVHKWRSEEQAIMVGTNTAMTDNPRLNVREWSGKNPVRIVIDKTLRLPETLHLFDNSQPSVVFTAENRSPAKSPAYRVIDFNRNIIPLILSELHRQEIQSVMVEGGARLIKSFIASGLWDEARIFTAGKIFNQGIKAPDISGALVSKEKTGNDDLVFLLNVRPL